MPTLTRDRILRTAIDIADRDGFEAVTLRRIASKLDVHVTSLYNHVPTREAVTDGVIEVLLEEAKLPTEPTSWETWVRQFCDAMSTLAATHPGAFHAFEQRPVQGARATASFEVALGSFTRAGFTPDDAYAAVKTVSFLALMIGIERALMARGEEPQTRLDELPSEGFPLVRSLTRDCVPEEAWAFAVKTLIAGLNAQLADR